MSATTIKNEDIVLEMKKIRGKILDLSRAEAELNELLGFLSEIHQEEIEEKDPADPTKKIMVKQDVINRRTHEIIPDAERLKLLKKYKVRVTNAIKVI